VFEPPGFEVEVGELLEVAEDALDVMEEPLVLVDSVLAVVDEQCGFPLPLPLPLFCRLATEPLPGMTP
jgi:hypothetical protein